MRTVEIRGGECSMRVEGFDMACPLCRVIVKSGESHHCKVLTPKAPERRHRDRRREGVSK